MAGRRPSLRSGSRARPTDGPTGPRTVSIWPFLVGFLVLAGIGLAGVLLGYSTQSSNRQRLDVPQTTAGTTPEEAPGATVPVTLPGGASAPNGVSAVAVDGDVTTFSYPVPEALRSAPVDDAVLPATAVPTPDGGSLRVSVGCLRSAEEALARISVTEDPTAVTVLVVGAVPRAGVPCEPVTEPRSAELPLRGAVGARPVVVVEVGTPIAATPG